MDPKRLLLTALGIIEGELEHISKEAKAMRLPAERAACLCAYTRVLSQVVNKDLGGDDVEGLGRMSEAQLLQAYREAIQYARN